MNDYTFWEIAIGLAGIGAIGSFVLWSLYKNWLKLPIFVQLTKKQTFNLMFAFLAFTFLFALVTLFIFSNQQAHEVKQTKINSIKSGDQSNNIIIDGGRDEDRE